MRSGNIEVACGAGGGQRDLDPQDGLRGRGSPAGRCSNWITAGLGGPPVSPHRLVVGDPLVLAGAAALARRLDVPPLATVLRASDVSAGAGGMLLVFRISSMTGVCLRGKPVLSRD